MRLLLFLWHPLAVFLPPGQAHLFSEVCEEDNLAAVLKLGIYATESILGEKSSLPICWLAHLVRDLAILT